MSLTMRLLQSCARRIVPRQRWCIYRPDSTNQLQQAFAHLTKTRHYSIAFDSSLQHHEITPSRLDSKAHPLGWQTIQAQVEPYFTQNWKFSSEKAKQGFLAVGFSQAFSRFFPLTLNDRVEGTCKMHYLALLIDGKLS